VYKTSAYHFLTATFKDLHIENSKNYKKMILPASHWLCVNVLLNVNRKLLLQLLDRWVKWPTTNVYKVELN